MTPVFNQSGIRILLEYLSNGREQSRELNQGDIVVNRHQLAAFILADDELSSDLLIDIIHVASYALKKRQGGELKEVISEQE